MLRIKGRVAKEDRVVIGYAPERGYARGDATNHPHSKRSRVTWKDWTELTDDIDTATLNMLSMSYIKSGDVAQTIIDLGKEHNFGQSMYLTGMKGRDEWRAIERGARKALGKRRVNKKHWLTVHFVSLHQGLDYDDVAQALRDLGIERTFAWVRKHRAIRDLYLMDEAGIDDDFADALVG